MNETEPRQRTEEEFRAEWWKLCMICVTLESVDLEALRLTAERAETVAPILYPTEYRNGARSLVNQRRILDAATALRDTYAAAVREEAG